jgi:hypothetical protein
MATLLAPDWAAEAAGSNGCSVAARLALDFPGTVIRLLLAWPATVGDPAIDSRERTRLTGLGASPHVVGALLAGQTLRLLPQADELPGCPEPPRPEFPPHLDAFLAAVTAFATG